MAKAVEDSDKTPVGAFIAVVKYLKTTMPASGTSEATTGGETVPAAVETEDVILKKIGTPFDPTLRFLWAAHHHPEMITAPITAPIQDEDSLKWEAATDRQELGINAVPIATPHNTQDEEDATIKDGATVAITKLAQSMVKH